MKISSIPSNAEAFKTMRDQIAVTPEGGAAMFVLALKMWISNPNEGIKCLIMQREINDLQASNAADSYSGYALGASEFSLTKSQLSRQPYIPSSYFVGATPSNNYQHAEADLELEITSNPYSGDLNAGKFKVFVKSSGADSPRPVMMVRNDKGLWKVKEYSSLIVGIRKSANEERKDDL